MADDPRPALTAQTTRPATPAAVQAQAAAKPSAVAARPVAQAAQPQVAKPAAQPVRPAAPVKPPTKPAMVAFKGADLKGPKWLRLMVLGYGKVGKSSCVISTAPKPVYVINSDPPDSLEPVLRIDTDFEGNHVHSSEAMTNAIELARYKVKNEGFQTIVWDTISGFSPFMEAEAFKNTLTQDQKEDGRRAAPLYKKYMRNFINRLFRLDAHVIVISHYLDVGGAGDEKDAKGIAKVSKPTDQQGIVPLLYGSFRAEICGLFQDIVFMEKQLTGPGREERVFVTGFQGVFGPGCRSIPGYRPVPADIQNFIRIVESERKKPPTKQAAQVVNGKAAVK